MTKFRTIFAFVVLQLFAAACSDVDSDLLEEQQEDIVSFLTTSHSPTLISSAELADALDDDPEFYTIWGSTAYRYINDYYNAERAERTEAVDGSTLSLTFWCYDFSAYTTPSDSYLYYTNDANYKDLFEAAGLNTQYWSFEPLIITLGKGDILKAIESSLVGCREGDSVEIYLTYNLAYGNEWVGVTSLQEPMAFFCTINSVEN